MSYANETSASGSATTPQTAPPPRAKSAHDAKQELKKLSEADFLKAQQANAMAAFTRTLREMKDDLLGAADVRQVYEQHPWMTAGGAVVAGFVAASLLVPSKEESALKKLAKWEKALRAAEGRAEAPSAAQQAVSSSNGDVSSSGKPQKKGIFATIATELIRSVAPALASAMTAGMATKADNNEPGASNFGGDDTGAPPNAP